MFDQDVVAISEGEGAGEADMEQEKGGLRGGRKAEPLRKGQSECWRGCWRARREGTSGTGGAAKVVGGRRALVRSVCVGLVTLTRPPFQPHFGREDCATGGVHLAIAL